MLSKLIGNPLLRICGCLRSHLTFGLGQTRDANIKNADILLILGLRTLVYQINLLQSTSIQII